MKKLETMIGRKTLSQCIAQRDSFNFNAFDYAIERDNADIIEYLIAYEVVENLYDINNENDEDEQLKAMFRLLHWLFVKNESVERVNRVLNDLNISNEMVTKIIGFKYPKASKEETESKTTRYDEVNIIKSLLSGYMLDKLKKIVSLIGDKNENLILNASMPINKYGISILENAVWNGKA